MTADLQSIWVYLAASPLMGLTATLLAVFYIPLFFVVVRRTTRDAIKRLHRESAPEPEQVPEAEA